MTELNRTLLSIAVTLILALTICVALALPFLAFRAYKRFKKMEVEQEEFATHVRSRREEIRRSMHRSA